MRQRLSLAFLVSANLLPVAGVLFLDWDVAAIIVLYWSENLVVGFYNILKMLVAGGAGAIPLSLFFLVHYGGFCAVHGVFITSLLLDSPNNPLEQTSWPFVLIFVELLVNVTVQILSAAPSAWLLGFVGLLISHGYSFAANFLLGEERQNVQARALMSVPYKRIILLHIAIIVGGMAVISLGQPLILLIVLVLLKIALDIALHLRERKAAKTSSI